MKLAPKGVWILSGGLLLLACFWIIGPELQYRREVRRYKIGTTSTAIEKEDGTHLNLQISGNILPEPATEDMKRRHPAYYIRTGCAEVVFNDYYEVIHVWKRTPLLRLMWRINSDWAAD